MPKFLFVYRSAPYTAGDISPEQMQKVMQLWTDWIGEGFQKGWMVDAGDALLPDGKMVDKNKVVTDGPFAESKEIVGGYSVVQAASYAAAAEFAKRCPVLQDRGGSVEIRQLAGLAPPAG
jgi:hypothetical protein